MGRIITLTSDLKLQDHYVASLKGAILTDLPNCNIVDVSHFINNFDILQAAFVVKNCYKDFPEGTIHIVGVDSSEAQKVQAIVIESNGQFFIGPDNGVFSLILEGNYDKIYKVAMPNENSGAYSFVMKEVYAKLAVFIAKDGNLDDICTVVDTIQERMTIQATGNGNFIQGSVMYIDSYRNAILNITLDLFTEVGNGRPFKIYFSRKESIDYICSDYNEVGEGEVVCIFGNSGNLELAINKDKAADLIGLQVGAPIQIEFI